MSRHTLSPEERKARLDLAHQRLFQAVEQLRSSADWLAYLAFMARFHTYSAQNVLLIMFQRPSATQVAGFHTWRSLGRRVKKGAKGIAILAPMTRKVEAAEEDREEGVTGTALVGFRIVHVFDVADTEGDALPEPPRARLLRGDAPAELWDALSAQVEAAGFSVATAEEIEPGSGINGRTRYTGSEVLIATAGRSRAAQTKTLAHELAHVLLHRGMQDRARAEVEAESVAYLVCDAFGLATDDYSVGYVAGWSDGDPEVVLRSALTVRRCADGILAAAGYDQAEELPQAS